MTHSFIPGIPEDGVTRQAALAAANRIIHGDGSEDDAQLVAGELIAICSTTQGDDPI